MKNRKTKGNYEMNNKKAECRNISAFSLLLYHLVLFIFFTSCVKIGNLALPVKYERGDFSVVAGMVDDLYNYPQDPLYYADLINPDSLLVPMNKQFEMYIDFVGRFFGVWVDSLSYESEKVISTHQYYQNQIESLFNDAGIGENKLHRNLDFAEEMRDLADLDKGFNTMKKGIMLNYSYIRVMPTLKPYFLDFELAGEGYPFDYWQNSTIPIGTPIFIYHETQNWALIDSHICSGWVPRNFFAYVNEDTINQILNAPQIAVLKDKLPLYNIQNSYVAHADIGTVFSVIRELEDSFEVFHFQRDEFNDSYLSPLKVPKYIQNKPIALEIPLPLTARNIAILSSEMMGQIYGWGGLYFNRDCSQSLLDLFIGFGVLLPRNGRAQAYEFGRFHDMRHIQDKNEKKRELVDIAVPFTTLVRTPGHIMLYLGHVQGEPIVFHTIWGMRTIDENNKEGRHILGRTVITTLEPGKELPGINPDMTLINRLEGITYVCPPDN